MNIFKYIKKTIVFGIALFCLTLAFQTPSYAANLEGSWQLQSLGGRPVFPGTQITAEFDGDAPDATISGSAGCNRYFSSASTDSSNIKVRPIVSTKAFCGEPAIQQEYEYFKALESATSYRVSGNNLQIISRGNQALEYVRAR